VTGFSYFVTNRHVAQPGSESGKPCKIMTSFILLNKRGGTAESAVQTQKVILGRNAHWTFPEDESVDLAIANSHVSRSDFDFIVITPDNFVTDEELSTKQVVEGDPVLFAGLFIQSFNEVHTLEPIVRSGTLAMIPESKLETTMNHRSGNLYLADAHVFGGNSGSPVFVDLNRFTGSIGFRYKFLGVVCGEMFENSDLTFNITTTLQAVNQANSGVSMIVPAAELRKLLNQKELITGRDSEANRQNGSPASPPKP
jgi:hypothetical protein